MKITSKELSKNLDETVKKFDGRAPYLVMGARYMNWSHGG